MVVALVQKDKLLYSQTRLKNNLKFQNGNMLLPDFWQDPIKFTKLSPKQGKQKLKILINELD